MSSSRLVAALAAAVLSGSLLSAAVSAPAVAAPAPTARVKVTVVTPGGVPAAVTLKQKRTTRVVSKRARGKKRASVVRFKAGRVRVVAPPITYRGKTYTARAPRAVTVRSKRTRSIKVVYRRLRVAQNVRVGAMTPTSVKVVWQRAPRGTRVVVRRAAGTKAVTSPRRGTGVTVRRNSATATRLATGRAYTFTAFTLRRGRVLATQSVTATPFRPGGAQGGFVAPSTTRVHTNPGTAPRALARGTQALLPAAGQQVGSGVVLPASAQLPGGFIGVVDSITTDGRYAVLRPAALDEVFDAVYGSARIPSTTLRARAASESAGQDSSWLREPALGGRRANGMRPQPTALPKCLGGTAQAKTVGFNPRFTPSGSVSHGFTKFRIFGKEIPNGAYVNASFNINVEAPLTIKTSGTVRCRIPLTPLNVPFQAGPVPMLFQISPVAEVSVTGEVDVKEVGFGGNIGASLGAKFSIPGGGDLSGSRTLNGYPLTPQLAPKTGNYRVGLAFGGDFIIGPGKSVAKSYGAVAGLEAQVRFVDAQLRPKYPMGDSRHLQCALLTGEGYVAVNLTAKAWYKSWSAKKNLELGRKTQPYGEHPFPSGCEDLPGTDEDEFTEDVTGDDVEIVDDELDGSEDQWGRSDAFTPGEGAWILSTGRMADIHGAASDHASTDLGLAGNERLSALSGFETHDAATYRVSLVPKKPNLHIRYLFASEEYPEYVGSEFNDVMAVYVNGENCALVDGRPVSVNTINQDTNADKYVPNPGAGDDGGGGGPLALGAQDVDEPAESGGTAMDGWTVPLQCDVRVTPGVPVSVEVAVADSSDSIYDSAVALLDRGIWAN